MKKVILLISSLLIFAASFSQSQKVKQRDLKKLYKTMTGEFSSEQQSIDDSAFFHIKLRMKPIIVNNDGYWFYVEQSMATTQEKPYRQRVYHLYIQDDTTIMSKVFEVKNPSQYINAWKDENKLKNITTDSLIDRQGCGIFLHKQKGKTFKGATPFKECLSSLRGATYATSEVTVYKDKLISWDRGWDKIINKFGVLLKEVMFL
jgi:hypothetical protein